MRLSISDNALLRSKSESSMLNWSGWLGWLLSVARWAKPTISSRWAKPTDECGSCCALSVVVARWTEPTAVELPAATADNLSKVGTWRLVVSLVVRPSNGMLVIGVSSGRADWQLSMAVCALVVLELGLVFGERVTIQS